MYLKVHVNAQSVCSGEGLANRGTQATLELAHALIVPGCSCEVYVHNEVHPLGWFPTQAFALDGYFFGFDSRAPPVGGEACGDWGLDLIPYDAHLASEG